MDTPTTSSWWRPSMSWLPLPSLFNKSTAAVPASSTPPVLAETVLSTHDSTVTPPLTPISPSPSTTPTPWMRIPTPTLALPEADMGAARHENNKSQQMGGSGSGGAVTPCLELPGPQSLLFHQVACGGGGGNGNTKTAMGNGGTPTPPSQSRSSTPPGEKSVHNVSPQLGASHSSLSLTQSTGELHAARSSHHRLFDNAAAAGGSNSENEARPPPIILVQHIHKDKNISRLLQ